jgi:hypothetical protein
LLQGEDDDDNDGGDSPPPAKKSRTKAAAVKSNARATPAAAAVAKPASKQLFCMPMHYYLFIAVQLQHPCIELVLLFA